MGCRNKIIINLLIFCGFFCIFFLSCQKKQDTTDIQTRTWLLREFGEETIIQSISPIPIIQEDILYWRISLLLNNSKRWDGLVKFSVEEKKYEKIEIHLPSTEEK